MNRYLLFNCESYDGCRGADGVVEGFTTKEELITYVKETEFEADTISVYDVLNNIAYDKCVLWIEDDDWNKEYDNEGLEEYLNNIK